MVTDRRSISDIVTCAVPAWLDVANDIATYVAPATSVIDRRSISDIVTCAVPAWLDVANDIATYVAPATSVTDRRSISDIVTCAVPAWLDADVAVSNVSASVCYGTASNVSQPAKAHVYDILIPPG